MAVPERCIITPISAFQSTNLSSKISSFDHLSDRILRSLGYPSINIEVHRDHLYENISIACEMFTKFAGYTLEYLVFNSNLYVQNHGLRLDTLFTAKANDTYLKQLENRNRDTATINPLFSKYVNNETSVYFATTAVPSDYFTASTELSAFLSAGIQPNEVYSTSLYNALITYNPVLSSAFSRSVSRNITIGGAEIATPNPSFLNSFDYDVMDYRKVISVTDLEEGSTTGINTLFTIEQTMAQQTYFSYAMGNYGFDLVSWYVLKDWLEMREKLLTTKQSWDFDDRTQLLRVYPQPKTSRGDSVQYYAIIQCYVERPLRDIIKEQWVYQYALALTKIVLGRIRGKFQGTSLIGGGTINADMLAEGLEEKRMLEQRLYEGAAGFGDVPPPQFFVG